MLGYEGVRAGVRGDKSRGTMVLEPGYELEPGNKGFRAGVRGY